MPYTRHQQIMKKFARQLRAARVRKYKSAQAFAHKMGIEPHTYRKYERGETEPGLETLVRLCEDLGITPNDLLPDGISPASGSPEGSQQLSPRE